MKTRSEAMSQAWEKAVRDAVPMETKPVPGKEDFNEYLKNLDPENAYLHPYWGLFEQPVDVEGKPRRAVGYIPENLPHCRPSVFVAIPSGVKAEVFLEASGWRELADKKSITVFMLEPDGETWGSVEDEANYIFWAYKTINLRNVFSIAYTLVYFAGYEDGAKCLQGFLMQNPHIPCGTVLFNSDDMEAEFMGEVGNRQEFVTRPGIKGYAAPPLPGEALKEIRCPMWMVADSFSEQSKRVLDYWKHANHCAPQALRQGDTDVYQEDPYYNRMAIDQQPVAKVCVTEKEIAYNDLAFLDEVWETFMKPVGRYVDIHAFALRPIRSVEEMGLVRRDMRIEGKKRYWYEYIPSYAKSHPEEKLPVVVALCGGGTVPESYACNTDWHKVAEEKQFIVVYPASWPHFKFDNELARPFWNDDFDPNKADDLGFFRAILEDLEKRQPIHRGKVYINGHSSGGAMSQRVALELPDIFTAMGASAAPIMTFFFPDKSLPDTVRTDYEIPVWTIKGERDGGPLKTNPISRKTLEYWLEHNRCGTFEAMKTYRSGAYNHLVYDNPEGIPMVRTTVIREKPHAHIPSEALMFWEEFFCKYTRDEQGKIHYMEDEIFY
jgi:poly(3-hydroxybutyrate) depolymerase